MASDPVTATTISHEFFWQHTTEPWHVLAYGVLAAVLAWWAWRRYGPSPQGIAGRIARVCRVAAVIWLVMMIAGPAWRTTATTTLPGRVLVAVDRSASMARDDGEGRQPRIGMAKQLVKELERIAPERQLLLDFQSVGGLDGPISASEFSDQHLATPGVVSPIVDDVRRLLATSAPDLLILVSDGRVTDGSSLESLSDDLRSRELKLAVLATGSETVDPKIWIDDVVVNKEAALNEIEPVVVQGSGRNVGNDSVTIRLFADDKLLETIEAPLPPADAKDAAKPRSFEARLEAMFAKEGTAKLRVEIQQGGLIDKRELTVTVRERKLQVLLVEQRPRYETRYLREALRRDHTITLHAYLLDGKRRLWGKDGPDHLPLNANELRDYDVVILGDLGPEIFDENQLTALDTAVRQSGTGLIWIPGESGAVSSFAKHKFGALLPVEVPDAATIVKGYQNGAKHQPERTAAALNQGVLDSGGLAWNQLPDLYGAAPVSKVKSGAEVLLEDQDHQPLVVSRVFGAGRSLFIAVDDTWRWRRNVGDTYLHRFHSQLIRYAAFGRRLSSKPWRIDASPRRAMPGEVVTLTLAPVGQSSESPPDHVTARMRGPDNVETLVRLLPEGKGFSARVPAAAPGIWHLDIADGPTPSQIEEGDLEVLPPSGELRDPRADLQGLQALARSSGGQCFSSAQSLAAALVDVRKTRVEILPPTGLWDSGLALSILVMLLAVEWSLRRIFRLP